MTTQFTNRKPFKIAMGLAALVGGVLASPAARAQDSSLDLVIVVDDTGSMGGAIANIGMNIAEIVEEITACTGGDVRWGMVSFADDIQVDLPFTTDSAEFTTAALALFASGGAGGPEASDTGLEYALELAATGGSGEVCPVSAPLGPLGDFRTDVCGKLAIMFTDNQPGGCNDTFTVGVDDVHAAAVADAYAAAGVKIGPIYVGGLGFPDPTIEAIMMNYATVTGGVYIPVPFDASCDVGDPADCQDISEAIIAQACVACGSPGLPGRMTGGGRIEDGDLSINHGQTLRCDASRKPQRLQVNWRGGAIGGSNRFHMTELVSATCTDDPDIEQGVPKSAKFDTFSGVGTGRYNGVDGATITFVLKDAGEPGDFDTSSFIIEDASGIVLDVTSTTLNKGNNQAH